MKIKRIAAAALTVVMAVGAGTLPASAATAWEVEEPEYANQYEEYRTTANKDTIIMNRTQSTTLKYSGKGKTGFGSYYKWNIACGTWSGMWYGSVYCAFKKPSNGTWTPYAGELRCTAQARAKNGHTTEEVEAINTNGKEISADANLSYCEWVDSGKFSAKYTQNGFLLEGTVRAFK